MPKIAQHLEARESATLEAKTPRYRPALLDCLKSYSSAVLRADVIAGIIVGIVALPLSIALAIQVGAPPQAGLYTAIVGGAVAALLGGSRTQVTGPTAAFIVILAPIYTQHGASGLMVAGLMAGVILVLMGAAGLGSLIKYVPYPVTTGFTTGIAVTIATIQLRDIFGLDVHFERVKQISEPLAGSEGALIVRNVTESVKGLPDHFHEKVEALYHGFQHTPRDIMLYTGIVGLSTVVVLILYPRLLPQIARRIPAPLVGVFVAVGLAALLRHFFNANIATIGSRFNGIPSGLPAFNSKLFTEFAWNYDSIRPLIMPATTIAMLGAIESLLSAVVADGLAGTKHDPNTELIGQGLANIASPLMGGIAATGAIARTATNIRNGGRTPLASLFHALTLLAIMLVAAPYASYIPMAALGAILLIVAYNMAELKHFRHLLRAPRSDVLILLTCVSLTVFADMVVAVAVGMILAAILFMKRMAELTRVDALTSVAGDAELQSHEIELHDIPKGVTIYSVDGPFFFGATEKAISAMESVGDSTRIIIMRLNRVPAMDASGLYALEKVYEHLSARGVNLILSSVRAQPRGVMAKSGLLKKIGTANIVSDVEWALVRCYDILGPDARAKRSSRIFVK